MYRNKIKLSQPELKKILTNLESNRDDVKNMGKRSLDIVSSFNYVENAKAIEKAIVSIQENV